MPFTAEHKPRMAATSRACRAIVAAREVDPALGERALRELQLLQFTTTRLLDEDGDLREALTGVPGLDADATVARIDDPEIVAAYEADRALARSAEGSPTHAQDRSSTSDGPVRFTAPSVIFERPDGARLEVGGFQPFEAYDTALANLDVSLHRGPPPCRRRGRPPSVLRRRDHGRGGIRAATVRPRRRRPGRDRGAAHLARGKRHRHSRSGGRRRRR